jgi:hypothetical protein
MSLIKKMLQYDVCVWWPQAGGVPDDYGQPAAAAAPVEIKCRWADEVKEFVDKDGDRHASIATVFVDRDVQIGDLLTHLSLANLVSQNPAQARLNPNTFEVRQFTKMPKLHYNEFLREAFL